MPACRITVPATCANLGPGFDCLGLALAHHNEVLLEWEVAPHPGAEDSLLPQVEIHGEGCEVLPRDGSHLVLRALAHGLRHLPSPPATRLLRLVQVNRIPLARGLGSSAAAIVAGLAAACTLGQAPLDRDWMLHHADLLEGHPDNVAPAIHGGVTAAFVTDGAPPRARCLPLPTTGLCIAIAVPDFRVSTEDARACMPRQLSLEDVVFTVGRTALLAGSLVLGRHELLGEAVRDRLHTPSRAPLVRAWPQVESAALEAGALGVFISGSGPTVGAFVAGDDPRAAEPVAQRMAAAFCQAGHAATPLSCSLDPQGVTVEPS